MLNAQLQLVGSLWSLRERKGQAWTTSTFPEQGGARTLEPPGCSGSHRFTSSTIPAESFRQICQDIAKRAQNKVNIPEFQSEFRTIDDDEPLALRVRRDHLPVLILADPRGERSLLLRASVGERLAGTQRRRCEHTIASTRSQRSATVVSKDPSNTVCQTIAKYAYGQFSLNVSQNFVFTSQAWRRRRSSHRPG